jgi:hypothetical protein
VITRGDGLAAIEPSAIGWWVEAEPMRASAGREMATVTVASAKSQAVTPLCARAGTGATPG